METKVLMAYASTHGSTQEIAEIIAATLREHELSVDLQPARQVRTLEGYNAVVLGAPLYMFHLHKDARRFLSKHRKDLTGSLPFAIFAGGPFAKGDEEEWQEIHRQLDQELAKYPWLRPVAVEMVGGRFDPTKLRFPWNLIPALKQMPASDLRDWTAIRAWASSLAAQLPRPGRDGQPPLAMI
ncbi:MAG: flavodoxin [Chloroflexi bacterium]|nr:flavodoxin [Chloroflexota bacterium]